MKKPFLLALAFLLLATPYARAEEIPAPPSIKIAPHRALYKMSLSRVKNGSAIHEATGTMLFDWSDDCEGWAIQQKLNLHFVYTEGEESDVNSSVVTWESKDGKKYNFNIRRLAGGQEDENYRGHATLEGKEGVAKYTVPKDKKDIPLPENTVFPSAHTLLILRGALTGEKLFSRLVFDGSDEAGAAYVSAFIGGKMAKPQDTEMNPELRDNPLLKVTAWPVRLAFYKPEEQSSAPDYEMDLLLQANGIARSMTIDYGDFSVSGVLTSLEPASEQACPTKG